MKTLKLHKNGPILVALRQWMAARGLHRAELMELWGVQRSSVTNRLNGKVDLSVAELTAALEVLGLRPEEFFRGVEIGFHPEPFLDRLAKENKSDVKHLVRHYLRRGPARSYTAEELRDLVASLESLRFRDPEAARDGALEILRCPDLDDDVAVEAWGVLGVIYRYEGKLSCTAYCYGHALRIGGSERQRAKSWQRLAMLLLCNIGKAELALEVTRWAAASYQRCGDRVGMGKTQVDEATILVDSGRYEQAIHAYSRGLRLLGNKAHEHRIAALQGTAICYVYIGDAQSAIAYLGQTSKAKGGYRSSEIEGAILFLKGEISLLLEQFAESAEIFLRVRSCFLKLKMPWEVTLTNLRLAKVYFLQNDQDRFQTTLNQMLIQLRAIQRSNKLLGAAFGEFLADCARGHVSVEILDEIYQKMRQGAQAAPPPLPRKLPTSN